MQICNMYLCPLQDIFLGETLGAVTLAGDHDSLKPTWKFKQIKVFATGVESEDGQIAIDERQGKFVRILENVVSAAYYDQFTEQLADKRQSAVVGSFEEQKRRWSTPPSNQTESIL